MRLLIPIVILCTVAEVAFAAMQAPERTLRPVLDSTMIVNDRGAQLEVLVNERATRQRDAAGHSQMLIATGKNASAPIGPIILGVVFNHALQQQGYISGEIIFKTQTGQRPANLNPALYPRLKLILDPSLYAVMAHTPLEFLALLRRLQARPDVAWVEPTIIYRGAT